MSGSACRGVDAERCGLVTSNVMENYFTLREASERLGVSHEAVRRLCHRGSLEHVRFKGRMLVRKSSVIDRERQLAKEGARR